ncbi:denticleless protein [Hordeum vulgare]|nr:denticleless protein [Hordeum vulgare]
MRRPPSFFGGLRARELSGGRAPARASAARLPYLSDLSSDPGGRGCGVISVEHSGVVAIPFAVSFCKAPQISRLLAVADEDGYVALYDTRRRLPSRSSSTEKSAETRLSDWVAHNNAIFDVCWIKEGSQLLTASGDQTVKIWSVENKKCLGVLSGHTGSVKSLSCHSSNPDLIVSGSRDGSFALWDLRCDPKTPNGHGEACLISSAVVKEAHSPTRRNRTRSRAKGASTSITSVLYLKDDISIATSGAADNIVKFWDTRNLKAPVSNKTSQSTAQPSKEGVTHGISSLSQDSYGAYIAASCMDHRIYLYSTLHMDKGPIKTYTGSKIESFFVKSAISPDGTHILGGSSDGNVYLWQVVDQPESGPIVLKGHGGEVTSVDWYDLSRMLTSYSPTVTTMLMLQCEFHNFRCALEVGKVASSSDDATVRVWNTKKIDCTNISSPTVIRKRVTAPIIDCPRSASHERTTASRDVAACTSAGSELPGSHSPLRPRVLEFGTPESVKKRAFSLFQEEALDTRNSPGAQMSSPSSVLNPPPSLKRKTIRDYFGSSTS